MPKTKEIRILVDRATKSDRERVTERYADHPDRLAKVWTDIENDIHSKLDEKKVPREGRTVIVNSDQYTIKLPDGYKLVW